MNEPAGAKSPKKPIRDITVSGAETDGRTVFTCGVPGDKSISQRVLLLAATMGVHVRIDNLNMGSAVSIMFPALELLGARISRSSSCVTVHLVSGIAGHPMREPLNLGPSSAAARFLLGLLAGMGAGAVIDGDESLRRRPMEFVVEPLRTLGANISYLGSEGHLPVLLESSTIRDGEVHLSVGSAQASSAIMFAAYAARRCVRIIAKARARDHTARLLRHIGTIVVEGGNSMEVRGQPPITFSRYTVPGDPSAAAYLAASHVLSKRSNELVIREVCLNPTRLGFFRLLKDCGAPVDCRLKRTQFGEPVGDIFIGAGPYKLSPFHIEDADEFHAMIDEAPLAAALATGIQGRSWIRGAGELQFKETDRLSTSTEMLRCFGASVEIRDASIVIDGGRQLHAAVVPSFDDHRIAMTAAALGCSLPSQTRIIGGGCAVTSFPDFDLHMRRAGFHMNFS